MRRPATAIGGFLLSLAASTAHGFTGAPQLTPDVNNNYGNIQQAINYCLQNYCMVDLQGLLWPMSGSFTINAVLGKQGFGVKNGFIVENGNNMPVFTFTGGTVQAMSFEHLGIMYANPQGPNNPLSSCFYFNMGDKNASIYNSKFDSIECTYAYRPIAQAPSTPGAVWGDRFTNIRCKANTGACIYMTTNSATGQPNNYFGNVYAIPNGCADPFEMDVGFMPSLTIENYEVNNTPCGLLHIANSRNVHFHTIRWENGNGQALPASMANRGMVEFSGDGIKGDGLEFQWDVHGGQIQTGGPVYLVKEDAASGAPSTITNIALWDPTVSSGSTLYGATSAGNPLQIQKVNQWVMSPGQYGGDVAPGANVTLAQFP